MLNADAATTAAIRAPVRVVTPAVGVDVASDGFAGALDNPTVAVSSVKIDRAITSDLPKEVRLVEGNAVAEADIALTGQMSHVRAGQVEQLFDFAVRDVEDINVTKTTITLALDDSGNRYRDGDYLVACIAVRDTTSIVMPDQPWDVLADVIDGSVHLLVYGRFVDDAEQYDKDYRSFNQTFRLQKPATFAACLLSFGNWTSGETGVIRKPYAAAGPWNGTSTTKPVTPTLAVTDDKARLLAVFARPIASTGTWTPPAGYDEKEDLRGPAASHVTLGVFFSQQNVGPGAYTASPTASAAATVYPSALIALPVSVGADETWHSAWFWSPTNEDSPIGHIDTTGRPVTVDAVVQTDNGVTRFPRFRGQLRSAQVQASSRAATLTALDGREKMRNLVQVPPIDGSVMGLNATWLVSQALYVSGYSPGLRPNWITPTFPEKGQYETSSTLWFPMHGSLAPMSGMGHWFDGAVNGQPPNVWVESGNMGTGSNKADGSLWNVKPTFVPGPYVLGVYAGSRDPWNFTRIQGRDLAAGNAPIIGTDSTIDVDGATIPARPGRIEMFVRCDGLNPSSSRSYSTNYVNRTWSNTDSSAASHSFEVGVWASPGVGQSGTGRAMYFMVVNNSGGESALQVTGPIIPADGQWHYLGWEVAYYDGTQQHVTFRLDDTTTTTNFTHDRTGVTYDGTIGFIFQLPVAEFHMRDLANGYKTNWLKDTTVIDCSIDRSTIELAAPPGDAVRECWQQVSSLADAEQAIARFREDGIFEYRTANRLASTQFRDSQLTLTAVDNVSEIQVERIVDTVRNIVSVPYAPVYAENGVAYKSTTDMVIPAGDVAISDSFILDKSVVSYDYDLTPLSVKPDVEPASSYALCYTGPNATGSLVTNVSVQLSTTDGHQGYFILFNTSNNFEVYVNVAQVYGKIIRQGSELKAEAADQGSIERYSVQPITVGQSDWVQAQSVAQGLADTILADLRRPQYVITQLNIVADPRLQLGDRVTIQDRQGVALDGDWWVTGITEEMGADGQYTMSITARQALDVLSWNSSTRWDESMWG